jgi:hypothetical protein
MARACYRYLIFLRPGRTLHVKKKKNNYNNNGDRTRLPSQIGTSIVYLKFNLLLNFFIFNMVVPVLPIGARKSLSTLQLEL